MHVLKDGTRYGDKLSTGVKAEDRAGFINSVRMT
jgi:hypothetical protein